MHIQMIHIEPNSCVLFDKIVYFLHEIIYTFIIKVNQYRHSMKNIILKKIEKNGGLMTTAQAVSWGVSKTMLGKYVKSGSLVRVRHGIYALPDVIIDDAFALHLQNENIVFSHDSALFLNGLADRTPFTHTVSVRSDKVLPKSIKDQCNCFYVHPDLFKIGLTKKRTTFGNMVPCYDAERTLCDILRSRRRLDDETVVAAIKNYSKSNEKDLFRLYEYAPKFHVLTTLKKYLEVLL